MASRLIELVAAQLELPVDDVHGDLGPASAAQWTSLKHLEIVAAIQDSYAVMLTPREIRAVRTIADLRECLDRRGVPE